MSKLPGSICILPWIHLEATSLGFVHPCCKSTFEVRGEDGKPLHLSRSTLTDAWTSEDMTKLRQDFLDGKKPPSCSRCWSEEAAGVRSKRMIDNDKFARFIGRVQESAPIPPPLYLDLKLGTTCNLKCRICSSVHSSKWAEEEQAIISDKERPKRNFTLGKWTRENPGFWKDLESLVESAEYLDFTGGEPFLIREHFEVLKFCVERGFASNIEIHYNTNGTIFPEKVVREYWPEFKRVDLMVSLDGVSKRFEYQRYGANWAEVSENTRKLSLAKKVNFVLCHTVNIFNVFYVDEFVKWAEENGYALWINFLHDPRYFCVQNLPEKAKPFVQDRLLQAAARNPENKEQLKRLAQFVGTRKADPEITEEMKRWILDSDRFRGEDFQAVFPEFNQLLLDCGWTWS